MYNQLTSYHTQALKKLINSEQVINHFLNYSNSSNLSYKDIYLGVKLFGNIIYRTQVFRTYRILTESKLYLLNNKIFYIK